MTQGDKERNVKYDEYALMAEEMLFCTDTDYAPWTIIEATDMAVCDNKNIYDGDTSYARADPTSKRE